MIISYLLVDVIFINIGAYCVVKVNCDACSHQYLQRSETGRFQGRCHVGDGGLHCILRACHDRDGSTQVCLETLARCVVVAYLVVRITHVVAMDALVNLS